MISFDFEYYKPETLEEAVLCYHQLVSHNKHPLYYGGGTEIVSMARAESLRFDAVIDLKGIPECSYMGFEDNSLVLGSALTLTQIAEAGHYPLLCETAARIADHTIQGKITLGGNLAGTVKYRETSLPLMITNCKAKVMTQNGLQELLFSQIFDGHLRLQKGDFLVQLFVDQNKLLLPYAHVKKTKMDKIDYPLITLVGNKSSLKIKAAVSGLANCPLILPSDLLSNTMLTEEERITQITEQIKGSVISDYLGSKEYRIFVLRNILLQMYENFKGE
ncbi:FAD binding domain-containing protein [Hydrogenoanaerobacterium sp.]|uniref:FAD binding domain-containing protein n=1 Tax=Hydrogenoanaerobacterium sp. TaxID=2953763 RepID=UPI002896658A|nr:FAD binding domain-containing protein [Hydrogenoanaerobacterium sp.]